MTDISPLKVCDIAHNLQDMAPMEHHIWSWSNAGVGLGGLLLRRS